MVVKAELDKLGLQYRSVDLGDVDIESDITPQQMESRKKSLLQSGLELLEDRRAVMIEKIKQVIIELVHYADEMPRIKTSVYISEKLNHDYTYLANLFSEATGTTIEHYLISHKIEKVKELLLYDMLNLTEISYKLNYSSVAHLSSQFKKVTGLTPSFFKKLKNRRRNVLESLWLMLLACSGDSINESA